MDLKLEALTWPKIRDKVHALNPKVAGIFDQLPAASKRYKIYKVKYEFGRNVLIHGKLHLPTKTGELIAIEGPRIPKNIFHDLGYNNSTCPVMFCLSKHLELYIKLLKDQFLTTRLNKRR